MYYTNIPESEIAKRLNFRMPDYTKVKYASGTVIEHWQRKVDQASMAFLEIEKLTILEGLRDSALIYATNWNQWRKFADNNGLLLIPLDSNDMGKTYSSQVPGKVGDTWRCALVRNKSLAAEWMNHYTDENHNEIGRLLGYPKCCRDFFDKYWIHQGYRDLTVPAIMNGGINGAPEANILARWNGIRLVSSMPCSFKCEKSIEIGKAVADIGRQGGYSEEIDTIYTILNMPYKYSSLHGIMEISTPIWKVSSASESYIEEQLFERDGEIPEFSASGKDFPFTKTPQRNVTGKGAFNRAIDHYRSNQGKPAKNTVIDQSKDIKEFDVNPKMNGFSSKLSQKKSHEPLLKLIKSIEGSIYDFGCGNGALLAKSYKLYGINGSGCDINKEAVLFGKFEWNLDLEDELISNVKIKKNTYEAALFMPGRLHEIDKKEYNNIINQLKKFKFIIAYGYSDWKDKIQDIIESADINLILIDEERTKNTTSLKYQVL